MSKNQYEHFMAFIEKSEDGGATDFNLVPVAIDLDPDKAVSIRQLSIDEGIDDLPDYILKACNSMHEVAERMVEQVLQACKDNGQPLPAYGYVDLVMQLQDAPHLLLANMLASCIANWAKDVDPENHETLPHSRFAGRVASNL